MSGASILLHAEESWRSRSASLRAMASHWRETAGRFAAILAFTLALDVRFLPWRSVPPKAIAFEITRSVEGVSLMAGCGLGRVAEVGVASGMGCADCQQSATA